jgi:hypothetical protein
MAPGRARDERKEQQWRRWIGEWRTSGLSVRAFCQRRRLTVASFHARRRVLRRRAAEKAVFVPVQVVAAAVPTQTSALEVVLTDGRTVRVAPGIDAATLRQLLAVGKAPSGRSATTGRRRRLGERAEQAGGTGRPFFTGPGCAATGITRVETADGSRHRRDGGRAIRS